MTKPTAAMRQAIAEAEVGDDVWGEDPTVNKLETYAAAILGKPSAMFVPSGTMANQISIRELTNPGEEMIVEADAHIVHYENGAASALAGIQPALLKGERGILTPEQIENAIRIPDIHAPPTTLICLENTHNRAGGTIYSIETISEIHNIASSKNIAMHLDGARLFNAACATGISAKHYASHFETVAFCLSKGLGAPIGSMIVSSNERISRMRRIRKMYGGGMRQAGILAAAGLYALEHNIPKLHDDHKHAKLLSLNLEEIPGIGIDSTATQTNIVVFDVGSVSKNPDKLLDTLRNEGILVSRFTSTTFRAVMHLDITEEDVLYAIQVLKCTLSQTN